MKKLILIFLVAGLYANAKAQTLDTAVISVQYNFYHLQDTTKPYAVFEEKMILYLGKRWSIYQSYERILANIAMDEMIAARANMSNAERQLSPANLSNLKMGSTLSYYSLSGRPVLNEIENLVGNMYFFEEDLPVIHWEISDEIKNISGFQCQKATGKLKGRIYEAWFCNKLAYNKGPWKLNGLPGLIMEASDSKKEIGFQFVGLAEISNQHRLIEYPKNMIHTNAKDINRIRVAMEKNINAMRGSGGAGSIRSTTGVSEQSSQLKVVNNPIELEN